MQKHLTYNKKNRDKHDKQELQRQKPKQKCLGFLFLRLIAFIYTKSVSCESLPKSERRWSLGIRGHWLEI